MMAVGSPRIAEPPFLRVSLFSSPYIFRRRQKTKQSIAGAVDGFLGPGAGAWPAYEAAETRPKHLCWI